MGDRGTADWGRMPKDDDEDLQAGRQAGEGINFFSPRGGLQAGRQAGLQACRSIIPVCLHGIQFQESVPAATRLLPCAMLPTAASASPFWQALHVHVQGPACACLTC